MSQKAINILEEDHLYNYDYYGAYTELVKTGSIHVFTKDITKDTLDSHFFSILNIFKDGIETSKVRDMKIYVHFTDNVSVKISVFYYFYNLMFWTLPLNAGDSLTSEYLWHPKDLTTSSIKKYIDEKFLEKHQTEYSIKLLNNCIDDSIYKFKYIDEFHLYLLNTINNEDTIELMKNNPEFNQYMHVDLSDAPVEDIKNMGMDYANAAISIIKNSDHCLRDAFRTGQGINTRQWKEFNINIGTKPDGNGGVYSHSINSSFVNGGLQSKDDLIVDSGASRTAQILSKENVGDAGHFSRILGLNNQGSRLHDDPNYICNTKNFQKVYIKDATMLDMYKNRWFRFTEDGIEHKISLSPLRDNKDLIGKTLYFRSPMTCASAARGEGICYRCYGGLAFVNYGLSVGKMAAEILCAILTQMLLSSKHLLESMVIALKWAQDFYDTMEVSMNAICIKSNLENMENYYLEISNITFDNEHDQFEYNAHVNNFNVIYPNGEKHCIHTEKSDPIYLSNELLEYIGTLPETEDDTYIFNFSDIKNIGIFLVKLSNAEISRTLDKLISMIKTASGIEGKDRNEVLQNLIDAVIEGKVRIDAVHLETLLSNQMRAASDDILNLPRWEFPNAKYHMIGLNKALTDHPSVTVSLQFEKLSKALYYPLNYKKSKPHSTDLFFMTQPQNLLSVELKDDKSKPKKVFTRVDSKQL